MNPGRQMKKANLSRTAIKVLLLVMILPLSSSSLIAQSFYGSIVGTVTDSSGAVVPDATVKVINVGTNEAQTAPSDPGGKFSFVNLVPAVYQVDVEKSGFKRFLRDQLAVAVGAVARVDVQLEVGTATETVEVSTITPLLQTDSSSLAHQISGDLVQQLPLNGRNVENLIILAPGVVPGGASQGDTGLNQGTRTAGGAGWGNYQIGGAIQGQSAQYIDGVPNNVLGGNTIALVPTQDAIQEFSVVTSNPTADFGRFAGGVVNMTTKSGTNAFHGSVYEYFRNNVFNANDFFSNRNNSPRPQFNQNQYGVEINGPMKRDKLFFLFTWEGFSARTGNTTPSNVPTSAASRAKWGGSNMQDGIFANAITDPLGNCNISTTANPGFWTITNLYTGKCGDPTNKVLRTFYPDPNQNPNTATSNWFLTTPLANNQNQYNARIDYALSSKQRIFGRYTYWNLHDTGHSEFLEKGLNGTTWPTNDGHNANFTHQVVLGDSYVFNPTTILDVRLNYVRQTNPNNPDSTTVDQSQFGSSYAALASQMYTHVLPAYNASGGLHNLYNLGNFPNLSVQWWNTYGINANLVKILGSHSFKFGAELRLMDQSGIANLAGASGTYTYTTAFTGDEWASMLMGYPTQATFNTAASTGAFMHYQAYYLSDNWQARPNLTFTLGLRYELPGAIAERNNKATVLLPHTVDPYTGITGTLALVNSSLYGGRTTVIPQHNLFAPRVGFSFRATPDTVLQAGYGISYLPNDITTGPLPGYSLVNAAATQANVPGGGLPNPLQTILQGFVNTGLNQPIGRSQPNFMTLYGSKNAYLGKNISGPVPNQPFPYVQQWNVALNHQFAGDWMAGIAYSGLQGKNLPGAGNRGLSQLASQYFSLGTALLATAPCANANGLTMTVGQCDRPYPFYNNVSDTAEFYAWSNYKSMQVRAQKRFGSAGVLSGNYTWARNMANTDTQNGFLEAKATTQGGSGSGAIQDWNNLNNEYSLISFDVTNRAVIGYLLDLPFGKGKMYAGNLSGIADALVSGWAINGITVLQSGFPIFFSTTTQNKLQSSFGAGTTRPNVVPGCSKKVSGSDLTRVNAGGWFNVSCFSYAGDFAFGNEPRVDPDLRAAGVKNFDFSLQKSTVLHESTNLEFRAEFFNVMNRVQFAPPGSIAPVSAASPNVVPGAASNGNFGQVSYQVNKPRQIQLSLRLNF
jgi:outer membrane receptor protein involved in Fe transport